MKITITEKKNCGSLSDPSKLWALLSSKQRENAEIENMKCEQGDTFSDGADIAKAFNDFFYKCWL